MKIAIAVVGKPKAGFTAKGVAHYLKLLTGLATIEIITIKPETGAKNIPPGKVRLQEAGRILKRIGTQGRTVALDVEGQRASSKKLVKLINTWERAGLNRLTFVIGGAWGLDKTVLDSADDSISLSEMTFSHEMSLLMLLEQLYRVFSVKAGRPYAK